MPWVKILQHLNHLAVQGAAHVCGTQHVKPIYDRMNGGICLQSSPPSMIHHVDQFPGLPDAPIRCKGLFYTMTLMI